MSTSSKPQLTAEQIQKTRAKQFRILVIGRANAGKTTILRAVCNTTDDPMIFDPNGEKIESAILDPSLKRGEHNIENEMIFKANPGFVFHDTRGFEAGGDQELKLVQKFLQQRSEARNVDEQLHAIWYCIPTTDDRPITAAEKKFFNECGTGLVPVIVLWTKTEALDLDKILQLMDEGKSQADAMQQAPAKAWADFKRDVYPRFAEFKYQPKAYVIFRKMHEPGGTCNQLIEKTAKALSSSEELQQLFVSIQQNSVELCMKYGIEGTMKNMEKMGLKLFGWGNWVCVMGMVLEYFPQIGHGRNTRYYREGHAGDAVYYHQLHRQLNDDYQQAVYYHQLHRQLNDDYQQRDQYQDDDYQHRLYHDGQDLNLDFISTIMADFLSDLSTKFNYEDATRCAIVSAIIGHLIFFLRKQSPTQSQCSIFEQAAQIYQKSSYQSSIKHSVDHLFNHPHSQVRLDILIEGAIQIALSHCLSVQ